jgi:hypothetical protein
MKCGTEMTLTSISLNEMGQTSRSGQLPRASRHDTAGHKPLQNSHNFISIVTDENIHMDVRFGNGRTKKEEIFDCGMNCFLIFAHNYVLRITIELCR